MTGEPEGLGLYGMVTPFGGDCGKHKYQQLQRRQKEDSFSRNTSEEKLKFLYLKHDNTDLLDTLNNGLWGPCNGNGTLCRVGQHVSCYLYLSSGWLRTHKEKNKNTSVVRSSFKLGLCYSDADG